jgi:hypothetical protein
LLLLAFGFTKEIDYASCLPAKAGASCVLSELSDPALPTSIEIVKAGAIFSDVKKSLFKALASINRLILPRISKRDLNRLTKADKAVVAFRYWVLLNSLD